MNDLLNEFNRRDFIKGGSVATVMAMLGGVELLAQTTEPPPPDVSGNKVRVAIIGCGVWGREILKMLGRQEQAEVVALCDIYPAAMRRCAADAPGARQVLDAAEIFADKNVQAVFIATPTHQHRDLALAALKAGKHVYCEAPLALTIEDARAMAQAAQAAPKQIFQTGLQMRADPQRLFLLPFIRSGALGTSIKARAQWHKKQSWRATSPNPEREKQINWRLDQATSPGLMGEIGIHQLDQAGWFLNGRPLAVTGFKALKHWKDDGRDVPETVQAVFEFPEQVFFSHEISLATSFDADYEIYYGTYAAVMMRENRAWMFKEVDSPLLGWEVYAQKETFHNETGIALVAGGSKQENLKPVQDAESKLKASPLYAALKAFLFNVHEQDVAIQNYTETFGTDDPVALLEGVKATVDPIRKPAASALDGFHATVTALKANEAVLAGGRMEFKDEWYQLS